MPGTSSRSALGGEVVVFAGKLSSLDGRAAQRLVEELGGAMACDLTERTTMLVLGAEPRPEDTEARALRAAMLQRAEALTAGTGGRLRIVSELDFCRLAGVVSDRLRQQLYAVRDVHSLYPAVRDDHLRYLEKLGLVRPIARVRGDRLYGFADLAVIKHVSAAIDHGQPLRQVIRALEAERKGQLALDFDRAGRTEANPARVVALERPRRSRSATPPLAPAPDPTPQARLAAKYFLEGAALDIDDHRREEAATAYRKALVVDPDLVPAIVNLANIHYAADRLIEAQALYERALGLEPDCFEAAFNLGNVHHDLGRYDQALGCYGQAVALNPAYADAHFYLAITLEKIGRSAEAKPHWRLYQQLSPDGEWADLAKEFSE